MSSRPPQHVLLVPGFFGFANVGDFSYYGHVRDFVAEALHAAGVEGDVVVVKTRPTASLRRRAARLAETVAETLAARDGDVHLVGHSSGGLDVRLFLSPGVTLPTDVDVERCAARARTAVTLASPHDGSVLATALTGLFGRQILRVLSLSAMYTLRTGRVPIGAIFHLVRVLSLPRLPVAEGTMLDNLYRGLLADFSVDRRRAIEELLSDVGSETDLLAELTPESMALLNAAVVDRPGVRYGCVVTRAPAPGVGSFWRTGLSPFRQATHALYAALYRITARMPPGRTPPVDEADAAALLRAFGSMPTASDNDGFVTTLAQIRGSIVHAAWADHLDVIGHFYLPRHAPPHYDWLNSGSRFSLEEFERMWQDVMRFTLAS